MKISTMSEGKNNQSLSYRWWVSSLCGVAILYKEIIFFLLLSKMTMLRMEEENL